jgi:hypothetical protein
MLSLYRRYYLFLCLQADAIRVKVGFPLSPDTRDPESILNYYSSVKVHEDDFFGNMISATWVSLHIFSNCGLNRQCVAQTQYFTNGYSWVGAGIKSRGKCTPPLLMHISIHQRMRFVYLDPHSCDWSSKLLSDSFPCRYPPATLLRQRMVGTGCASPLRD